MQKKTLVVLSVVIFLFVNVVNAQEIRFTGKQNTAINITERCEAFGFPCASDYSCNLTIENPEQDFLVNNVAMTRVNINYNYRLLANQSSLLGVYKSDVCCTNVTNGGCNSFYYEVTPSGRGFDTSDSIVYILILSASVLIFFFCLWGAISIPWRHPRSQFGFIENINYMKHWKIGLSFVCYLLFLLILNLLISISRNYIFLDTAYSYFSTIYFVMLTLFYPIIIFGIVMIVFVIIDNKKVKNLLNRGIKVT